MFHKLSNYSCSVDVVLKQRVELEYKTLFDLPKEIENYKNREQITSVTFKQDDKLST
jgi:hypothetical protein